MSKCSPSEVKQGGSEELINQAKLLLQKKQYQDSVQVINQALEQSPDNIDALYILAVCQRYLDQPDNALITLRHLQSCHPHYARTYQEQGHIYRSREHVKAITCYEKAVALNPALIASWMYLTQLYKVQHNVAGETEATEQCNYWSKMPKELLSVNSFLSEGKLAKAEDLCRFFLRQQPKNVEAMRLLAAIGVKHKVLDDAELLLESCIKFKPDFHQARFDYIHVLHKRQKYDEALTQAHILHTENPNNLNYQLTLANENQAVGKFTQAIDIYENLLRQVPTNSGILIMQAHAFKTIGRTADAILAYQKACLSEDNYGDAFWSLANLKTYQFTEQEISSMQARESAEDILLDDRFHLCFALGKAFEDKKLYDQAFSYYQRGNALKDKQLNYQPNRVTAECDAQVKVCSSPLFASKAEYGSQAPDPIFIVGLPRAGSTLLEQILSSHSQVDGTMELPHIMALSHRLNGRQNINDAKRYPKILETLSAEQLQDFGDKFIQDTQIYRKGAPYFIDKMPNNFRHIGLIHLILPNAKIIDARRHPMGCCFSGFKQLFAEGQEFSYGLENIGRYYQDYVQLMAHWDKVLPGKVLRVQYEDVVTNLEAQVRKILDFCGLPFEQECLNFHQTERSVRTASSEQVRQPIYQSGLEQWQNFEGHLGPLKGVLGSLLTDNR